MSGSALLLEAEERTVAGKKVAALRRSGMVPAVVYEKGTASEMVAISYTPLVKVWNKAGKHHTINLKYGKKERLTVIKDVTFDPVKGMLSHVAFHAVNKNEKISAEVPLRLEGTAPAAVAGLIVRTNVDHVVVKGLPGNIPDAITVDITGVQNADDDIRAGQLVLPKDVTLEEELDLVVVSVVVPRSEVEKLEEEVSAADVPSDHGSSNDTSVEE
jgi:large subunit ribosomal protein L25